VRIMDYLVRICVLSSEPCYILLRSCIARHSVLVEGSRLVCVWISFGYQFLLYLKTQEYDDE